MAIFVLVKPQKLHVDPTNFAKTQSFLTASPAETATPRWVQQKHSSAVLAPKASIASSQTLTRRALTVSIA